jgi:hypothetical protein
MSTPSPAARPDDACDRLDALAEAVETWRRLENAWQSTPLLPNPLFPRGRPRDPWDFLTWQDKNRELLGGGVLSAEQAAAIKDTDQGRAALYAAARTVVSAVEAHAEWAEARLEQLDLDSVPLSRLRRERDPKYLSDAADLLARAQARGRAEADPRQEDAPPAPTPPIPATVRDALTAAVRQERLVLGTLWNAPATGTDWNAGTFRLLELWRRELPDAAPPPVPEATNYREAQAALDVFSRAVEAIEAAPPRPQPVGGAPPSDSRAGQGEQPISDFLSRIADPSQCPECNAPVPELHRLQPRYTCRGCGRWQLNTGAYAQPVAGPPGTRPEYIQVSAPFWQAIDPAPPAPATQTAAHTVPRGSEGAPPAECIPVSPARHSPDFRSVHWFGTAYDFNEAQAAVVAVLWGAWEQGTPGVGHRTLLAAAKVEYDRLPDVFKVKGQYHPAWGAMIRSNVGSKGEARLCPPDAACS